MQFPRPMLACNERPTQSHLSQLLVGGPLLCTPKFDGIRCLVGDSDVVSRKLITIPNRSVVATLQLHFAGQKLDGELLTYTNGVLDDFNTVQSKIMSRTGAPDFKYMIFDAWNVNDDYQGRTGWLYTFIPEWGLVHERVLPEWAFTVDEVLALEAKFIEQGWEGMIARTGRSPYKQGRSTMRESYMLKFKPFVDEEATVIGWEPLYHNANLQGRDELGYAKRSSHQENLIQTGLLGALIVHNERWGIFKIGTGFTDLQRCNPDQYLHQTVTFKYQSNHSKDKPHAARFKAIRHPNI